MSGQVWGHTPEQSVSASTCDSAPLASVWPLPRQMPCLPCPHPLDKTPPYTTMKHVSTSLILTKNSQMDRILHRESCHMPIQHSEQHSIIDEIFIKYILWSIWQGKVRERLIQKPMLPSQMFHKDMCRQRKYFRHDIFVSLRQSY